MKNLLLTTLLFLSFAHAESTPQRNACFYDRLANLVRSSKNFPYIGSVTTPVNVLFDTDDGNKILMKLSVDKTEDEFDQEAPNSTRMVGWALYDIKKQKLFSLDSNEGDLIQIKFNKKHVEYFEKCLKN